jgi:cold shock CspA family protein
MDDKPQAESRDETGQLVEKALPGTPVQIDGWRGGDPGAGLEVLQANNEEHAKSVVEYRREIAETARLTTDTAAINAMRSEEAEARAQQLEWEAQQQWAKKRALQRPKGLQAFRILSMDESTAIHPAQMLPPRTHVSVTPTSGLERAQVKWFNRLRGFGFLTCGEGTPDIFVHMETLRRFGMTELRPGQYVLVRFGPGSKGMMAAEIHPETGPSALSSH